MIDMKITESEKKDASLLSVVDDRPNYPYGLEIRLDSETIKKLNLKDPQVGQKMMMEAMVEITSVSSTNFKGDEKKYTVNMQITQMELEDKDSDDKPAESYVYGGD